MNASERQNRKKGHNTNRSRARRSDMEFLPAALEILETPVSPIRTTFLWFICVLACAVLLWGWFGKFDIVASAQGKVQPTGRVKIIDSIETGKTKSVPVTNGMMIEAGDPVVQLDDTELNAEVRAKTTTLQTLRAEVQRRQGLLDAFVALKSGSIWSDEHRRTVSAPSLPANIPENIRVREQAVLNADLSAILVSLQGLSAQRSQRQAEIDGLGSAIEAQMKLTQTLRERVELRANLASSSAGPRVAVIDALQEHQEALTILTEKQAQLGAAKAALLVASAEGNKLLEGSIADNLNRKLEAERRIDELEQEVIKAQTRREYMTIRSPISGTVQLSSITAIGQVVSPGKELMRIVPLSNQLEIEAFLANRDVGFVKEGQPAIIKVEAYPFTRFGVLDGRVLRLSKDAVPEPDAQQLESTITQNATSTIPTGNVPRVQNLVFPVTLSMETTGIVIDGRPVPLNPGMGVTVEITTGKRRILEYLFSPLAQITSEAMTER